MNVQKGDMAIVIYTTRDMAWLRGHVFKVGEGFGRFEGGYCWESDPPSTDPRDGVHVVYQDKDLRRISPPAGTITTEEVTQLYSPSPVKEVA